MKKKRKSYPIIYDDWESDEVELQKFLSSLHEGEKPIPQIVKKPPAGDSDTAAIPETCLSQR